MKKILAVILLTVMVMTTVGCTDNVSVKMDANEIVVEQ